MIPEIWNFFNHPEKGGKMSHFSHIYSEMGKEKSSHVEMYHLFTKKKTKKEMKWAENETFYLIMMMVKKLYKKLFTKSIYKK